MLLGSASILFDQALSQHARCLLNKDRGTCRAFIPRWYYNSENLRCETFAYGGCFGNENNFETEEECQKHCHTNVVGKCELIKCTKNCEHGFKIDENGCEICECAGPEVRAVVNCGEFICEQDSCQLGFKHDRDGCKLCECHSEESLRETCRDRAEVGPCRTMMNLRWYYDNKRGACDMFYYGGCGGNANNFETEEICDKQCKSRMQ